MAEPNILKMTSSQGKSAVASAVGTGGTVVISAIATGYVAKVNAIYASNQLVTDTTCSVYLTRSAVDYAIANAITVPVGTTLDVLSKSIYLQEGDSLKIQAGDSSGLDVVVSYEEVTE